MILKRMVMMRNCDSRPCFSKQLHLKFECHPLRGFPPLASSPSTPSFVCLFFPLLPHLHGFYFLCFYTSASLSWFLFPPWPPRSTREEWVPFFNLCFCQRRCMFWVFLFRPLSWFFSTPPSFASRTSLPSLVFAPSPLFCFPFVPPLFFLFYLPIPSLFPSPLLSSPCSSSLIPPLSAPPPLFVSLYPPSLMIRP